MPPDQRLSSLIRSPLRLVRRIPAAYRLWSFNAFLTGCAALLFLGVLAGKHGFESPITVPWYLMAFVFFAAELKVVDVHFRREKHSFTLSEVPAVVGFFVLTPTEYLLAMLVGTSLALLLDRQSLAKFAFNLSAFAASAAVGLTVFHLLATPGGAPDPVDWIAAFVAASAATVVISSSIATAITVSDGAPQFQKLPEMVQFGLLVAIANTSLALLAVAFLWSDPRLLTLLVVPLVVVFLAYRAYASEREKHERLELLYQSSRILQHSPELDSALAALLENAREMFRAERAEIVLWPKDGGEEGLVTAAHHDAPAAAMQPAPMSAIHPLHRRIGLDRRAFLHVATARDADPVRQAMVVPLLGEKGLIGSILIANRLTEGTTFGEDDLRLLETLANQSAVALENGQLEQSLSELSRLKEELRFQAYHDSLTGLANRSLFVERVDQALAAAQGGAVPVVLFLDLDNFKDVNDTLGHAAGDRLLVAVADRVRSCVRGSDIPARLGGDEFAVLMDDVPGLARAQTVATRLIEALAVTFPVEGHDLKISASIGVAAGQGPQQRSDDLLRNADVAMYTAKQAGKDRFAVFEPTMHAAIVARHRLSTELSRGISEGEIVVYFQPLVALATGVAYGAEALARWRHPERGIVQPDDFIPLAEESGAIIPLGRAVLFEACRQAASWHRGPAGPMVVSVNLSAAQLGRDDFVDDLTNILRATGLPGDRLVLEMTETVMFHDTQVTIARLTALRELGVRVAIDDFGTGYSSLGYLRRFPVDILKIAKEFIAGTGAGPDDWAFAHSIVALGQTLGLRIIAEGIEEEAQLAQLRELGCELGQGFLFAHPMPGDAIAALFAGDAPWDRDPREASPVDARPVSIAAPVISLVTR
jgi:diguanylate cyclase (GGDEF)-like protein